MNIAGFISVFFVASSKFLFAPTVSFRFFNFWETILFVSIGGIAGVSFFYLASGWVIRKINENRIKKEQAQLKKGKVVVKKVFTPFRRKVIRVKNSFGLIGIAFLTPCILSIPIGSIIAARFYRHNRFTIFALYISVIFWGFLLTYFNDIVESLFR